MKALALVVLLAAAPAAAAADDAGAESGAAATIKAYVVAQSSGGVWTQQIAGRAAPLRLSLRWVNPLSLRPMGPQRYLALAVFADAAGATYDADFDVSLGGWQPEVLNVRWITRAQRDAAILQADAQRRLRDRLLAEVPARRAATAAKRAALPPGTPMLPVTSLPSADGAYVYNLASCPVAKCLTIYVAPWCPYCHAFTPQFLVLRQQLEKRGVLTRFLVTADSESNLRLYAWSFGPDTMIDPQGLIRPPGFPNYCVSADGGEILSTGPINQPDVDDTSKFISKLGL